MLLTIGAAVVVLGVLIFVHELGHFVAAKAVGVGVPRFSLGLGPLSPIRWKRGETEYVLSWIPFGGYVKMATAEDDEHGALSAIEGGAARESFPPEKLFENKPLWARIIVIVAGVTMNGLFAWFAYTVLAATYGRVEDPTTRVATVDTVGLPAAARPLAALPFGTQIIRINHDTMGSWDDIAEAIIDPRSSSLRFEFAGGAGPVTLPIPGSNTEQRFGLARALHRMWEARIGYVAPGHPAARAGLAPGDLIVRADRDTVRYWEEFVTAIEKRAGETVGLTIRRGDSVFRVRVVPVAEEVRDGVTGKSRRVGRIGVAQGLTPRHVRYGVGAAMVQGARQTGSDATKVWYAVKGLVMGRLSPRELGGPILIGQLSGQFARVGFDAFLSFIAFFSVNLAILNLLPVPVLDGGHLLFLLIEGVRGKPLSVRFRLRLSQLGMAFLLGIMMLALTNDVLRLFAR